MKDGSFSVREDPSYDAPKKHIPVATLLLDAPGMLPQIAATRLARWLRRQADIVQARASRNELTTGRYRARLR